MTQAYHQDRSSARDLSIGQPEFWIPRGGLAEKDGHQLA